MSPEDESNTLMERCLVVQGRCDSTDDFTTRYTGTWDRGPTGSYHDDDPDWLVGFYERDQGKRTATGPTLRDALVAWLDEYEDWLGVDEAELPREP